MKKDPIRIQAHVIFGFLILEFLFGMFVNLFVQFPDTRKEQLLWEFAKGQASLIIHMVIALLLVIGGIVFLARTIRRRDRQLIVAASVGLFTILAATYSGMEFVSTQQDPYSFAMATAFILALVSYGWAIYKAK
jgi:hypothetical protein